MISDKLTALKTTNGQPATKRHVWCSESGAWQTESYSAGREFEWAQAEVDSIESLSERLRVLEEQPEWFIIRGGPARSAKYLRRTYRPKNKRAPAFEPVDRQWLCIDIDGLEVPEGVAPGEPGAIAFVVEQLPGYFHGVTCHWQWSSSAGIKDQKGLNLHLWYWLDRPACGFSLREWAKDVRESHGLPVDSMLYNPVQPHFTANPIIEGAPDPIEKRSGLRAGEFDELSLPDSVLDLEAWRADQQKQRKRERARRRKAAKRAKIDPRAPELRRRYALSALDSACRKIESAPEGDRHRTLFSQAASVAGLFHTGHLDESSARIQLEEAALAALAQEGRQKEAVRTVADAIEHGRKNPRDLSHVGAGAADKTPMSDPNEHWLSAPPITCKKFERTSSGCEHYLECGACALEDEFMCVEWMKVNPAHSDPDTHRPPRSHWSNDV